LTEEVDGLTMMEWNSGIGSIDKKKKEKKQCRKGDSMLREDAKMFWSIAVSEPERYEQTCG
jgi:hypothetical protein